MSSTKFAAITASLLARKGDAAPSLVAPVAPPVRPALVPRDNQPAPSEPRQPNNAEKMRRIMVFITQEDLERLSIAAIKKDSNRHDIVRAALNDYFRKLSAEFAYPCPCMEGGPAVPEWHAQYQGRAARPSHPVCAEDLDSILSAGEDAEKQVAM